MQIIKKIALLVVSIYLSIQIGSYLFFKFYIEGYPPLDDNMMAHMTYDKLIGYRTKKNHTFNHQGIIYQTDSNGFREIKSEEILNSKNMFILGDSMVWGWGKQTNGLIQSMLREKLKGKIKIHTIADIGHSSSQVYLNFLNYINHKSITPHYIVWINSANDSYNNNRPNEYDLSRPIFDSTRKCFFNMPPKRPIHFSRAQILNKLFIDRNYTFNFNLFRTPLYLFIRDLLIDIGQSKLFNINNLESICNTIENINGDDELISLNIMIRDSFKHAKFLSILLPDKTKSTLKIDYNKYIRDKLIEHRIQVIDYSIKTDIYSDKNFATPANDIMDDHISVEFNKVITQDIIKTFPLKDLQEN